MEQKKITSLIRELEETLRPTFNDVSLCEQYAWWTLCAITGKEKITLMTQGTIELTQAQHATLADWLDKMITQHMPIQYLLGSVPFNDLDILVQPPTLIPRPETEEWVINLIDQLKKLNNQALTILDVCSGSGCIALALAKAFPQSDVFATDISSQALALAQKNAKHNNITNVTFVQSDLFNELATDKLFDIVVGNPPYISFDEFTEMDDSVTTWEDPQALVADDNGRAIIDAIIEQAPDYLKSNKEMEEKNIPQLVLEIGYTQAHKVSDFMKACGFIHIKISKDLEGKERVVSGRVGNVITPFMEE
ncbi:MAG: peptide chain release factor N(5)-glutamine methyltransferase [Candidatus Babeliales bacterium]|nr:peptide chain release factor N(5)-glutamine methyltransferase [Candidatus Babeliales bacterium]